MDDITKLLKDHYSQCFQEYGATSKGVDWGKETDVLLRHRLMLDLILNDYQKEENNEIKLLDVGCGFGAFWEYIQNRKIKLDYTGIDVADNMIQYASKTFDNANFYCKDFLNESFQENFDYIICNGILTQKLEGSILKMDSFAKKLIEKMFSLCKKGIAFNIMSTKVNFMASNLYYHNPVELLGFCFSLTNKIRLEHSYPLFEYTIYLYKEDQN